MSTWSDPKTRTYATQDVIHVPSDYGKIQWAIDNASAGSTILVSTGIYFEHLTIGKALTLQGDGQKCIIDGNFTGNVIEVTANGVSICGFVIQNGGTDFWDTGIYVHNATFNTISNNTIINNGHGIWLTSSSFMTIINNSVSNNQCAMGLISSSNITIAHNNISSIKECGIGLEYSNENTVTTNNIADCGYGVWTVNSEANTVFRNNFINNTQQAYCSNSTNAWDSNGTGNYWSDYKGNDTNHDGIGDTPYVIDMNNEDHYPMMETVTAPEFSPSAILLMIIVCSLAILALSRRKPIGRACNALNSVPASGSASFFGADMVVCYDNAVNPVSHRT